MIFKETRQLIKEDLAALAQPTLRSFIYFWRHKATFRLLTCLRILSCLKGFKAWKPVYGLICTYYRHLSYITGIQIDIGAKIGGGICFPHHSCIIINGLAKIGKNVVIFQGVTVGGMRGKGVPNIGDNVVLASGSKIIGKVKIGNNVFVGANAVVTKDIEDNAVVVGVPAHVLNHKGPEYVRLYIRDKTK